jgi:hypothetical protein
LDLTKRQLFFILTLCTSNDSFGVVFGEKKALGIQGIMYELLRDVCVVEEIAGIVALYATLFKVAAAMD